ncbi:peptidoglycan -binding protein [Pontibaca salina]|uniref:Peptidoglycan -binding protein n=1 Tax=Pontibaca salina TaxID=2795731 RepID=A0A934LZN1_9RHOB|nr:peptidoglycan -binding protein [Pontibaca salina]MBI6628858.1 peptidoglycan -binding protein [Pontibaca salina]
MALQRRTGQRFQASIWPGFVDAMTGLLLVLMFLLTIFMVVQFVLRETISGQESELDALTSEVGALSTALGMEEQRAGVLEARLGALNAALSAAQSDLAAAQDELASQSERIASLSMARDRAEGRIEDLEQARSELLSEQQALTLALAQSREEFDAQAEAARLAAARREALEALVADLRADKVQSEERAQSLQEQLSDEEAARLAEAAAAQALRDKLADADAELTAMTLFLERQRQEAEETLHLLAEQKEHSTEAQRQTALLNQQVAALRGQLGQLQALLGDYKERDAAAQVQLQNLGTDLNAALARAASEERKRRLLEETERQRLAQEAEELRAQAKDLERYRSEFFGRLRDLLGNQEGIRIEGDRFVFSSEVLFPSGSALLSPAGQQQIARVADILRGIIDDIPPELDWVIRVDGHTDSTPLSGYGRFADNWELSQARALSVVRYMVDALEIPPDRLTANGFGQFQPVNTADTAEARAQNRRIELKLTEK